MFYDNLSISDISYIFGIFFRSKSADTHINTLDPDGVSLAAIKALIVKNELLVQEMTKLCERIEELEEKQN